MSLLGDDGRGYELARKLETLGVWRTWLGDSAYATFAHFLASPTSWDAFMRPDTSKPKSQIHLQLRVRALLFDKASVALFLRPSNPANTTSSSAVVSKLNPEFLQLHADDVYFTLERESGAASIPMSSKPKGAQVATRYGDFAMDSVSQKFNHDDLPETWYNLYFEKHKASRPYKLSFGERDSDKRTPEEMSAYLCLTEKHKRKRVAFIEDQSTGCGNLISDTRSNRTSIITSESGNSVDEDPIFLPETMFTWNCVPDSALPSTGKLEEVQKLEVRNIFDTLPQFLMTRSALMIERLGIRPEYLNMEQRGIVQRRRNGSQSNKAPLSQEQACHMSTKAVAKLLSNVGFEGGTEVPMEVLSQLLGCHIRKLGRMLKILADSYRKQCSPIELLKMFLQTAGYGNCVALAEHIKDGARNNVHQTQQHTHGIQSQMQPQQSPLRIPQQIPRQMHPQMVQQQNLVFQQQQQLERMRRRQPSTPRAGMDMDKDRPLVQVKLENPSELPMDGNAFNTISTRHPQMQLRQQQLAAMSNFQAQPGNQFRQMASLQMPTIQQSQGMSAVRAPPVKVEGFQELMGGDTSLKHDAEDNKLTSPQSK